MSYSEVIAKIAPTATVIAAVGWLAQFVITQHYQKRMMEHQDTMVRKREVYARFITGMRVAIRSSPEDRATVEERKAFMKAYDESWLWTKPESARAIANFMDMLQEVRNSTQEEKKAAYLRCVNALRNECGGAIAEGLEYRFVTF